MDALQKGAIGAKIIVDFTDIDLSLATGVDFYFRKNNGTQIGPYSATIFLDDDNRTKAKYITLDSSFLDRIGVWSIQGYVTTSGGYIGPSEVGSFEVLANIFTLP